MSNRTNSNSKTKVKRGGKTNTDKANEKSEEDFDISLLDKPLQTSINSLSKVLQLYESTTTEIREFLTYECDILYECRICRSIFRSISNFIVHKRIYCRDKYDMVHTQWPKKDDEYLDILLKESTNVTDTNELKKPQKKTLHSIIDNLTQKQQFGFEIENFSVDEFYKQNEETFNDPITFTKKLELEQIPGQDNIVYQTLKHGSPESKFDNIKLEAMEIEQLTNGQTAILGPEGKVLNIDLSNPDLVCKKCNITFTTRKTLLSHIKYKHENSRIVYPCLECTDTFASVWNVYRHMFNIHRKSVNEVRKLRSKIEARAVRVSNDQKPNSNKHPSNSDLSHSNNLQQRIDEMNQEWMHNFETDNEIQMCGGCGRRFERKAALNSHSQMCQKRIAATNIINANKQKRQAAAEEQQRNLDKKRTINHSSVAELDKKLSNDMQNSAKRRKIGIQIRHNYSKVKETRSTSAVPQNVNNTATVKPTVTSNSDLVVPLGDTELKSDVELQEAEIVSIPSTDSSPSKDDQEDPLAIKEDRMESDDSSDIEEIIDGELPISNQGVLINGGLQEEGEEIDDDDDDGDNDDDGSEEPMKLERHQQQQQSINENTMKLMKLMNVVDDKRPTLDDKMLKYVNQRKMMCIPCGTKFSTITKLRQHMAVHFSWWRYRCDICPFKAYEKIDVIDHIKETHNIKQTDRIEALTMQIPDWETYEMSSWDFISKDNLPNLNPAEKLTSTELPIICTPDIDSCYIIESESMEESTDKMMNIQKHQHQQQQQQRKTTSSKAKKKPVKTPVDTSRRNSLRSSSSNISNSNNNSDNQTFRDNTRETSSSPSNTLDSNNSNSSNSNNINSSSSNINSNNNINSSSSSNTNNINTTTAASNKASLNTEKQELKRMVYEVIFGNSGELKESIIKNKLTDSNLDSSSTIINASVNSADNANSSTKTSILMPTTSNKKSVQKFDSGSSSRPIVLAVPLESSQCQVQVQVQNENQIQIQAEGNLDEEFSHNKVTLVDPKNFLQSHVSNVNIDDIDIDDDDDDDDVDETVDDDDHDVYIVENEELVAV